MSWPSRLPDSQVPSITTAEPMRKPRRLRSRSSRPLTRGMAWRRAVSLINTEMGLTGTRVLDAATADWVRLTQAERLAAEERAPAPPVEAAVLWQLYPLLVQQGQGRPDGEDTTPVDLGSVPAMPGPVKDARTVLSHYLEILRAALCDGDSSLAAVAAVAVRGMALGLTLSTAQQQAS